MQTLTEQQRKQYTFNQIPDGSKVVFIEVGSLLNPHGFYWVKVGKSFYADTKIK